MLVVELQFVANAVQCVAIDLCAVVAIVDLGLHNASTRAPQAGSRLDRAEYVHSVTNVRSAGPGTTEGSQDSLKPPPGDRSLTLFGAPGVVAYPLRHRQYLPVGMVVC